MNKELGNVYLLKDNHIIKYKIITHFEVETLQSKDIKKHKMYIYVRVKTTYSIYDSYTVVSWSKVFFSKKKLLESLLIK